MSTSITSDSNSKKRKFEEDSDIHFDKKISEDICFEFNQRGNTFQYYYEPSDSEDEEASEKLYSFKFQNSNNYIYISDSEEEVSKYESD